MAQDHHHHRSTTKQHNKPFKTKHATKSALKDKSKGKVESLDPRGSRKTPQQQLMSKLDRRNRAKQLRRNHAADRESKASVFSGKDAAPRIVTLVPLSSDCAVEEVLKSLNESVEANTHSQSTTSFAEVSRFKQKVQYLTPSRDIFATLDACRASDFVLFVLSANEEVDEIGEHMLRTIESQGVGTVLTGVWDLARVEPAKRRPDVLKSLKSYITHFFAAQEKVHDLGNRQDCSNVMRSLCTVMPKGIRWREDRSWMIIDEARWTEDNHEFLVTGHVRGKGLKADRLVTLGDWGDFQISKIVAAPSPTQLQRARAEEMALDVSTVDHILDMPTDEQDDLAELAPEETMEDVPPSTSVAPSERRAVLLDDHVYFHDNEDNAAAAVPKRLPRGTSKYQAAWYLGDVSDSGSDLEDVDDDHDDDDMSMNGSLPAAGPADGHFEENMQEPTEGAPTEYPQSEYFADNAPEDEAEQIEAYRKQRRDEAEEDLEFPDEIELHPGVNAKERLAKYRGLKSLRTSQWETEEDKLYEPEEWRRLLDIADYKSAKNRVIKEALHGGVKPGTRVHVHVKIPLERHDELKRRSQPTALFALLKHEHKQTAINVSITLSSDYPGPIKSKTEMIMQCGPRRFVINPLFSQGGNTPNNVHKFDRYLHPGRTAVATFIGPVTWGSVPCLFFKAPDQAADPIQQLSDSLAKLGTSTVDLIATGTSLAPSTQRVIAKRIILTGHPYKIHKKLVTVRYMFFSAEDVNYFRALQLWTKRGRSGYVKEPLGTHGYFKATFDGKVNPLDSIAVSMYKRVWPRHARLLQSAAEDCAPQLVAVEEKMTE